MGCIRLDILEKSTVPLKVVYRKSDVGQKSEQSFTSVDPLADKYPDMSPYIYVGNNPINAIDMNGDSITPIITKGGGHNGRDLLTLHVTGKIINMSNNNVNMEQALADIKSTMESSFQGEYDGMDVNMIFDFNIANSIEDIEDSDHVLVLAEPSSTNKNVMGAANGFGGKVATVDADYFTGLYDRTLGGEGERTSAHEMGHLFGLQHRNYDKGNLMSQGKSEFRGNEVNNSQLGSIINSLFGKNHLVYPKLNQGPNKIGKSLNIGHASPHFRYINR